MKICAEENCNVDISVRGPVAKRCSVCAEKHGVKYRAQYSANSKNRKQKAERWTKWKERANSNKRGTQ